MPIFHGPEEPKKATEPFGSLTRDRPADDSSKVHPMYLFVKRWYVTNPILPTANVILVGIRGQKSYELNQNP